MRIQLDIYVYTGMTYAKPYLMATISTILTTTSQFKSLNTKKITFSYRKSDPSLKKFEDIKGVIKDRNSKDRKCNGYAQKFGADFSDVYLNSFMLYRPPFLTS